MTIYSVFVIGNWGGLATCGLHTSTHLFT